MIIRYVYREHNGSKQLTGCVLCTDEGKLGYSVVHPNDRKKTTKALARKIALGRAEKCDIGVDIAGAECWMRARRDNGFFYPIPSVVIPYLDALAKETEPLIRRGLDK